MVLLPPLFRGRIIPARAGFTAMDLADALGIPDHPRSRGVYHIPDRYKHLWKGSSPLARGLLLGAPWSAVCEDGSSPLARGLLDEMTTAENAARIIPARAGFTMACFITAWAREDHPRSRGVYLATFAAWTRRQGSSPLARGLPRHHIEMLGSSGIIPARAGFTSRCVRNGWVRRDHPRSRGVYSASVAVGRCGGGSSPLARGLLKTEAGLYVQNRIIPARAGFTEVAGLGSA